MTVLAKFAAYTEEGKRCGGGSLQLPRFLDWFDIEVKAHYFGLIGQGPPDTHYLILESQGQEKLIAGITLTDITHAVYKERATLAEAQVNEFIDQGGYSREPRNQ